VGIFHMFHGLPRSTATDAPAITSMTV